MPFRDRRDAGRRLARALSRRRGEDAIVLGLPRGGVPVAYEVARELGAPLDVWVARKVGAPGHPEFGVGAVAPGGVLVLDEASVEALGIPASEIDETAARERVEMERRLRVYRGVPAVPDVEGRTAILVDDGVATGVTTRAALLSLHRGDPRRVVLAVPVGAPDSIERLRADADEVVALETPTPFQAVGMWYETFDQTSDEEVLALLDLARRERAAAEAGHA